MSVRKGIQLKSDVKISELFENAPAQHLVAGPPSYLQFLGKIDVKRLHSSFVIMFQLYIRSKASQKHGTEKLLPKINSFISKTMKNYSKDTQ